MTVNTLPQVNTIPQVKGRPFVGVFPKLLNEKTYDYLLGLRNAYGDVYQLNLGVMDVIVLNRPEHMKYILRDNRNNYHKGGPMWDSLREVLGQGLAVVDDYQTWVKLRRIIQPQFHRRELPQIVATMTDVIAEEIESWHHIAESGKPFNASHAAPEIALNVVVRTLLGTNVTPEEINALSPALHFALDYATQAMIGNSLPNWIPMPGRKKYDESINTIRSIVYTIIDRRKSQGEFEGNDILSNLMRMVDEDTGEGLTHEELFDQVVTMVFGGVETTAVTASWIFHFLGQYPEVVTKLKEEVDRVLEGRQPKFEDIPNLVYHDAVVKEVLRFYPASYWMPRTSIEDDEIDGYHIPAGSMVVAFIAGIQRHPEFWQEPNTFIPDRFMPENANNLHRLAWAPFSMGPRKCIADQFAMIELVLTVAQTMQKYDISSISPMETKAWVSTTLKPKNDVIMKLSLR